MTAPVYLLADSQLLFWQFDNGDYFFQQEFKSRKLKINSAAYIGASNDDRPEFFELFQAAMEVNGCSECFFVKTDMALKRAKKIIQETDLVLLAGGDVSVGWEFIKELKTSLENRHQSGVPIIGLSAGAMQLASLSWSNNTELTGNDLFSTVGLVPCLVSPHEEEDDWKQLKKAVELTSGCFPGLGIPMGAGVIVEEGQHIAAIRKPVVWVESREGKVNQSLLLPETA